MSERTAADAKEAPSAKRGEGKVKVTLRVCRQDAAEKPETRRFETIDVSIDPEASVLDALRETEVLSEGSCFEGVCGACTVLIGGRARLACMTRAQSAAPRGKPIVIEPLSKLPLVRDLIVDRTPALDALDRARAFIAVDSVLAREPAPASTRTREIVGRTLGECMSCSACLEACPEFGPHSDFIGAEAINAVRRLALHPIGALEADARLDALMGPGGVADCGKAQACVEVCPVQIPLGESIGVMARAATKRWLLGWLD